MPTVLQAPFFPQFMLVQATVAGNVLVPAANYRLRTTLSGTGTAAATYSDQAGTSANATPIILNSLGMCNLWLTQGIEYRLDLYDPTNTIQQPGWPLDDIAGIPIVSTATYVPVAGGVTMTGLFSLSGNATSALNPVPLQQLNTGLATNLVTASTIASCAGWVKPTQPCGGASCIRSHRFACRSVRLRNACRSPMEPMTGMILSSGAIGIRMAMRFIDTSPKRVAL